MNQSMAAAVPLLFVQENERVCISELRGGQNFKNKCIDQGIVPGRTIEMVTNNPHGPCVVAVEGSRVMIGSLMLSRILVKRI